MHYILDENREPKEVELFEWVTWLEKADRVVKQEFGEDPNGFRYFISTVFLGLDYSFAEVDPPQLFETMVFKVDPDGNIDYAEEECLRCATWEEAENQHEAVISRRGFTNLEEKAK